MDSQTAVILQQTIIGAIVLIGVIVFLIRLFGWAIKSAPPEILERYSVQHQQAIEAQQKANDFIAVLLPLALRGGEFLVTQTPGTEDDKALQKLKDLLKQDKLEIDMTVKTEEA